MSDSLWNCFKALGQILKYNEEIFLYILIIFLPISL